MTGLDIEAGSIAACEVVPNGNGGEVRRTAVATLEPGLFHEGEITDRDGMASALSDLFARQKLSKQVRLGLANQKVAVRTLQIPELGDRKELENAIRFQAQDHIPMPLEQAVLDYVVADRPGPVGEGERTMTVVIAAARRDMVLGVVETLRAAGLKPVGLDVSAFAMIRAQLASGAREPNAVQRAALAQAAHDARQGEAGALPVAGPSVLLHCNLGDNTNLAVARGDVCLFARVSGYGIEGIAQRLAERRRLSLEHARQWLVHVGLERPVEEIEGDPETVAVSREVLEEGAARLADELRISLEFYGSQEGAQQVTGVRAGGPGSAIPGMLARLGGQLGLPFEAVRPPALSGADALAGARLTLSYGLGLAE